MKEKFKCKDNAKAVYNYSGHGPTFGGGCDIHICNNANTAHSGANFPNSFETTKYPCNQATWTLFSGGTANFHFTIREWEVYEVNF